MSVNFDKIDVSVNNSGLYAESASLQSSNNLSPVYTLGRKRVRDQTPNGPLEHQISINYFPKTSADPNFQIIDTLKNQVSDNDINPVDVVIGGITGKGYLTDFSLESRPNQIVAANVTYSVFDVLSGDLREQPSSVNQLSDNSIAHGWTSYLRYNNDFFEVNTYGFSYSVNTSWETFYVLGKKEPKQVDLTELRETFTVIRDDYKSVNFSGEEAGDSLFDDTRDNIKIIDATLICSAEDNNDFLTGDITNSFVIDISGAEIVDSQLNTNVGSIAKDTVTMEKFY